MLRLIAVVFICSIGHFAQALESKPSDATILPADDQKSDGRESLVRPVYQLPIGASSLFEEHQEGNERPSKQETTKTDSI